MSRVIEKWKMPDSKIATVTWNPCNCHPNDVMVVKGKRFKDAGSYINQNKRSFTCMLKKRGWVRIERVVLK